MARRRGVTLIELLVGLTLMVMTMIGALSMMVTGLRSYEATTSDINLSQPNAQALRRVTETIRQAVWVSISSDGRTLTYMLPATTAGVDPVTGEREYVMPLTADGITRSFSVLTNGDLVQSPGGRVLVRDVTATDPEPSSSQFNSAYAPFQMTTIGSRRAITVNLITLEQVNGNSRFARMKTTVLIRNSQ